MVEDDAWEEEGWVRGACRSVAKRDDEADEADEADVVDDDALPPPPHFLNSDASGLRRDRSWVS